MNFLNEFIMPDLIIAMVGSYFLVGSRDQYILLLSLSCGYNLKRFFFFSSLEGTASEISRIVAQIASPPPSCESSSPSLF